jgi:hypothetical protein
LKAIWSHESRPDFKKIKGGKGEFTRARVCEIDLGRTGERAAAEENERTEQQTKISRLKTGNQPQKSE